MCRRFTKEEKGVENVLPNYVSGDYAVGTERFTIIDNDRDEILGAGEGKRRIAVRMYYPVCRESIAGMERAEVLSERKVLEIQKSYRIKKIAPKMVKADCYENAAHVEGKQFPLVIYSHGYNAYIEANNMLCCDLASHGYVVASVGHANEAVINEYDDGSYDLYDKKINKMMYDNVLTTMVGQLRLMKIKGTNEEIYEKFDAFQRKHMNYIMSRIPQWAQDCMCVVKDLELRYSQWIDFSVGIGATGHSLGGATAYYLCHHEERITCGINIDGGLFGEYENMTMTKPFMQICCEDNYNVETRSLFGSDAPVECEVFKDMKHLGFTDAKFYGMPAMMVGKMDGVKMYERLSSCHLRFLNNYLIYKKVYDLL